MMNHHINSHMRVGIIHPMVFPEVMKGEGPIIETALKILEDPFFGAIEVSWVKNEDTRKQLATLLHQSGMSVVYAAGPPILTNRLNLNALDDEQRKKSVQEFKMLIDEAYSLGAKIFTFFSGPCPEETDKEKAKALLLDSLKQLCRYAQDKAREYTMFLSLENFDRTIDKKCLIGPTSEATEIAKTVCAEYKNFGLTVDLSHLPLLGETPSQALNVAKEYLAHVHIGNCVLKDKNHPYYGDTHPRFGIEGGENDIEELAEFLYYLRDCGYFQKELPTTMPVVSFEVKPTKGESSLILIANSKRKLLEAWEKSWILEKVMV